MRGLSGLGQRELGGAVGLQQPHISAIGIRRSRARFDTLLDIVRVLNLDLLVVPREFVPAVQSSSARSRNRRVRRAVTLCRQ